MGQQDASTLFQTIGEKTRLKIIKLCFEGEQSFEELLRKTKLEKTLLSKHLKVLRESSILLTHKEGRQSSFSLNPRFCSMGKNKTLKLHCCEIKLK